MPGQNKYTPPRYGGGGGERVFKSVVFSGVNSRSERKTKVFLLLYAARRHRIALAGKASAGLSGDGDGSRFYPAAHCAAIVPLRKTRNVNIPFIVCTLPHSRRQSHRARRLYQNNIFLINNIFFSTLIVYIILYIYPSYSLAVSKTATTKNENKNYGISVVTDYIGTFFFMYAILAFINEKFF